MSKLLLLPNPILTTSLIYPMAELYPISIYNDQQGVLSPPLCSFFLDREGQQLCPLCHAFMHIFAPYIPLGGRWHELIWHPRKLRFHVATTTVAQPHYFFVVTGRLTADVPIGV